MKINNIDITDEFVKRGEKSYHKCICYCGKIFEAVISHIISGHTKSCGCYSKEQARERIKELHKNQKRENHPMWNKSLTIEDRINRRNLPETKIWRDSIYIRDNYTCQNCKKIGGKLCAHHLNSYHWAKNERFDLNNGTTLCYECHKTFHLLYGNRNNTKQQFKEFIGNNHE